MKNFFNFASWCAFVAVVSSVALPELGHAATKNACSSAELSKARKDAEKYEQQCSNYRTQIEQIQQQVSAAQSRTQANPRARIRPSVSSLQKKIAKATGRMKTSCAKSESYKAKFVVKEQSCAVAPSSVPPKPVSSNPNPVGSKPMCEYASPPIGCKYIPGTEFVQETQCGLVLSCGIAQARYLRIETVENGWVSWREIEVFAPDGRRLTSANTSISAVSQADSASSPKSALDGDSATTWNAGETNFACRQSYTAACPAAERTGWIEIDLGRIQEIGKIRLQQSGNTTSEISVVKIKDDVRNGYVELGRFTPPIGDSEWLSIPAEGSSVVPRIGMVARFRPNYQTLSDETADRENAYREILATPTTSAGGSSAIVLRGSNESPQSALLLWKVEDASYFIIEKFVTSDAALGTLSNEERASCGRATFDYDAFMFFAGYGALASQYSLNSQVFFHDMALMPQGPGWGAHQVSTQFCQIGKVYTTKITAINKNSGKSSTYEAVVKVAR